jgi:hypothetical protein
VPSFTAVTLPPTTTACFVCAMACWPTPNMSAAATSIAASHFRFNVMSLFIVLHFYIYYSLFVSLSFSEHAINELLVAAHLMDNDIVLLSELFSLMHVMQDQ